MTGDARFSAVLRALGFAVPDRPGFTAAALAAREQLRELDGQPVRTWAIGEERVRCRGAEIARAEELVCSCGGRSCPHVAAVLWSVAEADPERRATLERPAWELVLAPLAPPRPRATRSARARYELRSPGPGRVGLSLEPILMDERGDRRFPSRVEELVAAGVEDPADLALHAAWLALEQARRTRSSSLVRHLTRTLLTPLSLVDDVRLDGAPVQVLATPVSPELVAERDGSGGLTLRWSPPIRTVWTDAGVVRTKSGEVRPLSDTVSPAITASLAVDLPPIPAVDVRPFVERWVVERGLQVTLPPGLDPVHPPAFRSARLELSEVDGALRVRLGLRYGREGVEIEVDGGEPSTTARIPGVGLVRRDLDWEDERRARFTEEVGGPLQLRGDEATDWLVEVLPGLASRWEVFGDDRLVTHRVRGAAVPVVRFSAGTDWFDLDVRFRVGDQEVEGGPVVAGWLTGRRWLRLDGGGVAALPARWLERHASVVDHLASVRRAQGKLGSWHAWMASELLEEVGGPAEAWLGWVRALSSPDGVERRSPPAGLTATLRPYQREGFSWLCFLRDHGLHGVLADEMGLGKTVQALALLLDGPRGAPALVVAPTSVLHAWKDEAARFAPGLRVATWHGLGRRVQDLADADLVVTTWALLRRDQATLTARRWSTVVLDEAQFLKNPGSLTARAARRLVADHRVALTGTPLENDLVELWSLFQFLMPGYLGRRTAFHARYQVRSPEALAELSSRLRPFLLRRRKAQVARDLPPITHTVRRVPLSDRERALYDRVRNTVREAVTAARTDPLRRRSAVVLEGLTRLRQACCHPALLPFPEAAELTGSAKLDALLSDLEVALPSGSRVLVFSQWVRLLDQVASELDRRGLACLRLDGGTTDRAGVVRAFQDPAGPPVLLVSIKAGGTGLNLTAADRVVLLDPWWNPAVEAQATDRAHRIGQTRPVTVIRLVAADTVEDRVLALQEDKRRLFEQTVDGDPLDVSALGTEDLLHLLA